MNIWILTIGSSDVQLKPKNNWTNLHRSGRIQLIPDRGFAPSKLPDSDRLRVPSRVMGVIYTQPQASLDDLDFPLISNFINKLKVQEVAINQVILILSDQSVFPTVERTQKHPYWQDTCTLQPILEKYLTDQWKDISPDLVIKPLILESTSSEEGLDNWDAVLKLLQQKFVSHDLDFPEDTTIYVSHQAGTPAISSAVQFCSLATFGDRVKFLVSNEYNPTLPEKPLEGSSYLRGIRIQESKALLAQYDYVGVRDVLGLTRYTLNTPQEKLLKKLLDAGEQWNFAEFHKFKNKLLKIDSFKKMTFPWWRLGYESAYLAIIRFHQGNTVESLFHSFRAMEGTISRWAEQHYRSHILKEGDKDYKPQYGPQIQKSICSVLPDYFNALSESNQKKISQYGKIGLYGDPLYEMFRQARPEWRDDPDIEVVWKTAKNERNTLFHRIEGLQPEDILESWNIKATGDSEKDLEKLEARLRGCLNFILVKDLTEPFKSLEEASMMFQAHQEIKKAIDRLPLAT